MTSQERFDWLLRFLTSSDGALMLDELMASYVLDEDMGIIEERGAIPHPHRAYYEAGQRSVVLKLRALAKLEPTGETHE